MAPSPRALAHRAFRILWIGSLFAFTAQWVQQLSVSWVGYELTESPATLGIILGARAIPMFLLAPFSGVAADRYERKRLLAASQLLFGIASLIVAGLLAAGWLRAWHLFAFVFVTGIAATVERNARHAIVRDVVPREAIVNAVALNNVSFSGARVVAPAIAGVLLAWAGAAGNFTLQGVIYVAVAASFLVIRIPRRAHAGPPVSAWSSLKEGLRYTTRDPTIRVLALSGVVPYFLLIPAWGTLFPVFAKDIWAAGPQGLGILLGAVGLGGLLGGIVGTYTARLDRLGAISLAALALFAGSLIAIGLSPTVYAALPFVVLAGVGEMLNATTNQTLVQMVAPDHMRGRVTSLLAVYPAFISVGAVIVGAGADWLGAPVVTVTLGIAGATLCAAFWFLAPRLRELRLAHYR